MINKNLTKNFYLNLILIFFIFALDRITKIYVINYNESNYSAELFSSTYLDIILIWNKGIAFGLLSFNEYFTYNLLTFFIFLIIFVIFIMYIKSDGLKKYSLLMIFSGATGNLYDRIFFRAVPDFIDFHIGQFHWFIFNVADIFITVGVIFMILFELIGNNEGKNEKN